MKNWSLMPCLLVTMLLTANTGCKKNTEPLNTPPVAIAGADINLEIPLNYTELSGTTYDPDGDIPQVDWTKISGPQSFSLEWENQSSPKLFFLEEGVYEFEFRVIDAAGAVVKDTVKVTVSSNLRKHMLTGITSDPSGLMVAEIPQEVWNNVKWVFVKYDERYEKADDGPSPNIDYWFGGGSYYELLPGNRIGIFSYADKVFLYY